MQHPSKKHELPGHVSAGLFCAMVAIWWMYNHIERYLRAKKSQKIFQSRVWYRTKSCWSHIPLEPILKTSFFFFNFLIFLFDFVIFNRPNMIWQHGFLMLSLCIVYSFQILYFFRKYIPLPPNSDVIADIVMHGLLFLFFYFHNDSSSRIPYILHNYLIATLCVNFISSLVQACHQNSFHIAMFRALSFLLTSVWLFYVGFILEFYDLKFITHAAIADAFIWCCLISFVFALGFYALLAAASGWNDDTITLHDEENTVYKPLTNGSCNGGDEHPPFILLNKQTTKIFDAQMPINLCISSPTAVKNHLFSGEGKLNRLCKNSIDWKA